MPTPLSSSLSKPPPFPFPIIPILILKTLAPPDSPHRTSNHGLHPLPPHQPLRHILFPHISRLPTSLLGPAAETISVSFGRGEGKAGKGKGKGKGGDGGVGGVEEGGGGL